MDPECYSRPVKKNKLFVDEDSNSSSVSSVATIEECPDTTIEEPAPRHKSLLFDFCQKRQASGFRMPKFSFVDEGDLMVHGFVFTVTIETPYGNIEETSSPNPQKKPSEFHAAFLAYQALLKLESGSQQPTTADRAASSTSPPASSSTTGTHWKNKLQELLQTNGLGIPVYEGLHKSTVRCRIDKEEFSFSSEFHSSEKEADQQAAWLAYTGLIKKEPALSTLCGGTRKEKVEKRNFVARKRKWGAKVTFPFDC